VPRPQTVSDAQILAAMRHSVLSHGPAVSLDVVADALHVTPPALLKRFGSRKQLMIEALLPPVTPPWVEQLSHQLKSETLRAQLTELLRSILMFMADVMPCMVALSESGIALDEVFKDKKSPPQVGIDVLSRWLDDAKQRGVLHSQNSEVLATAILGSFQTRLFTCRLAKKKFRPQAHAAFIGHLTDLIMRACAPPFQSDSKQSKKGK
jgi:AcrR family transcriptional regulator